VSVERVEDLLVEVRLPRLGLWRCDAETWWIPIELEGDRLCGAGGAVFDGQADVCVCFLEIEVGVAPGVEVGGPPQCLSGDGSVALAGVVYQKHGQVEASLKGAQVGQERRDLGCGVLIESVEPDEGVEYKQSGPVFLEDSGQALPVAGDVEPELVCEDEEDG